MKNPVATVISYALHPLIVPTYIIAILLNMNAFMAFMIPFYLKLWIVGMLFVVTFALPAIMVYMMYRRKVISSLQMEVQKERFYPLLTTAIFWGLGYNLISKTGLPVLFYQYLLGGIASIVVAMLINIYWKISLHMLGMGGLTGVMLGIALRMGMDFFVVLSLVILLSGGVGYARLKVNSHNPPQVYAGYLVGVALMLLLYLSPLI